jgi:hypothetical protein
MSIECVQFRHNNGVLEYRTLIVKTVRVRDTDDCPEDVLSYGWSSEPYTDWIPVITTNTNSQQADREYHER